MVSYRGWPLSTYLADADPLHATGQAADDDGGYCYWHLIRPSGQIVTRRADARRTGRSVRTLREPNRWAT